MSQLATNFSCVLFKKKKFLKFSLPAVCKLAKEKAWHSNVTKLLLGYKNSHALDFRAQSLHKVTRNKICMNIQKPFFEKSTL